MDRRLQGPLATAAAVAVSLCALEGSMRLAGRLYERYRLAPARADAADRITVLCVGDSFTWGGGALPEWSYPRQLQGLLDARSPGRYAIRNAGALGMTSSRLAERMPYLMSAYHPKIVVILIGANNASQLSSTNYSRLAPPPSAAARARACLQRTLSPLRVYKLVAAACRGASFLRGEAEARRILRLASYNAWRPEEVERNRPLRRLVYDYADSDPDRAEAAAREILRHPGGRDDYCHLPILIEKKARRSRTSAALNEALPLAEACTRLAPGFAPDLVGNIRSLLGTSSPERPALQALLRYDLHSILETVRREGAHPILAGYPGDSADAYGHAAIARDERCAFVDLAARFRAALGDRDPAVLFSGDGATPTQGHPNARGYGIVAEAIRDAIENDR